jgi:hypothetical protein
MCSLRAAVSLGVLLMAVAGCDGAAPRRQSD